MAKKISGLTIAINADTSGVTAGLKDLTTESISLSQQLKTVDKLLEMDSNNVELASTRQKLLSDATETAKKKLEALKGAQADVQAQFERGEIGTREYVAFQEEIVKTENRLRELESTTDDTGDEMQTAAEQSSSFGEVLQNSVAKGAELAADAVMLAADAAKKAITAIIDATAETAAYGDEIDKTSQKLGMSAEAYQEWDAIMQHSGTDISQMTSSMKKLAEAIEAPTDKTTEAFEKIGISMEDAAKMSQEDLFAATITGLQKMESGTERTATASALLGKQSMELGALLNTSAEDTEAMRQKVHELGGVMSYDAVKASAGFQDSLQDMKTAFAGVKRGVASTFMPSLTQMMDGIGWFVSGHEEGMQDIEKGFDSFLENLADMADQLADAAADFLPAITEGITKNLPKLVQPAIKIVSTLVKSLVQNLPLLVSAAKDIILSLANDISKELPRMIPSIVEIILEIVDILTDPDTLSELIDASIEIIIALADGLIKALPKLIERAPEIIENLCTALVDNIPKLLETAWTLIEKFAGYIMDGKNVERIVKTAGDIITEIAKSIVNAIWKIAEAAAKIVSTIIDKIKGGDYVQAGRDVINGFMDGITEAWDKWADWWEGVGEKIYDFFHPNGDDVSIDMNSDGEPAAAAGAYITRPTRLLTGEGGRKEVVLPLEQNTGWADILADKLAAAGGGGIQIANLVVNAGAGADGRRIADDLLDELDLKLRQRQITANRGIGGLAW